jgi:ribonuclease HII
MPSFEYEREVGKNYNIKLIAGVDEVGRGALAGPIVAGAVIFDYSSKLERELVGVCDSKILSKNRCQELGEIIKAKALDYSIGVVDAEEIDEFGIGTANVLAFKRTLDRLKEFDLAFIDGRKFHGFDYRFICLEKGESKSYSIAAASIIAKVFRDELMRELHWVVPDYDFIHNKGYGVKKHKEMIKKIGPSAQHRKSFLGFLSKDTQSLGF